MNGTYMTYINKDKEYLNKRILKLIGQDMA